jgi:hypothetical protein
MSNYVRQSSLADGDIITAALFNDEYNQLLAAFAYAASGTTGHQHDGEAGEGGNVHTIGDQNFLNKIVVDSTNNRWGIFVEVSSSSVEQIRIQDGAIVPTTDDDIDLGTSSLEFKDGYFDGTIHVDTLDVDVNATVAGTLGVTGVLTATSLDISGAIDVAGTTNLDVVDIDGAVDIATTLTVGGNVDFNGDLDVDGTTNLDVVDIDGAVDIATTLAVGGNVDFNGDLDVDGTTNLDVVDIDGAVDMASTLAVAGVLTGASLDISGNIDIDGITNLDAVDIDGAVQIDAAFTSGVDGQGYDTKFFGDTASAFMIWDTSADDLIFSGGAGLIVPDGQFTLGSTAVTSTAAELNLLDTASANSVVNSKAVIYGSSGEVAGTLSTAAQANITSLGTLTALQVDNININGNAITSTAGIDLTISPLAGQQIVLDGTIIVDAGVVTGATSITSTAFVGDITGNVTGNTSGTAATVTTAAQTNITSLGTLTALTVDNLGVNGNTITANSGALNLTPATGSAIVLDGTINVDAGVVTGATSITSTAFVGAVTGNADTATALATARTIGGTSFDGTANIAVGLADTTTALATARTIGGTSFDGTANIAVGLADCISNC